jgi:hypothetical protein
VFLLPDCVCLADETAKLPAQILRSSESKVVDMVTPRNRIDSVKERSLMPLRQDQVPDDSC